MAAQAASPLIIPLTATGKTTSWGYLSNPFLSVKKWGKSGRKRVHLLSKQTGYVRGQEERCLEIDTDEALKRLTDCTGLAIDFCHFHSECHALHPLRPLSSEALNF